MNEHTDDTAEVQAATLAVKEGLAEHGKHLGRDANEGIARRVLSAAAPIIASKTYTAMAHRFALDLAGQEHEDLKAVLAEVERYNDNLFVRTQLVLQAVGIAIRCGYKASVKGNYDIEAEATIELPNGEARWLLAYEDPTRNNDRYEHPGDYEVEKRTERIKAYINSNTPADRDKPFEVIDGKTVITFDDSYAASADGAARLAEYVKQRNTREVDTMLQNQVTAALTDGKVHVRSSSETGVMAAVDPAGDPEDAAAAFVRIMNAPQYTILPKQRDGDE
jgi:hypothetical protein